MVKKYRFSANFLALAVLLAFCVLAAPQKAWATDQCADGTVDNSLYSITANNGQNLFMAKTGIYSSFGVANIMNACNMSGILNLFTTLSTLSTSGAGPFGAIGSMIVSQIVSQVVRMIGQVCQAVVQNVRTLINNAINSALGGICIPMPSLGLGISVLKVQPTMAPSCGSNSLSLANIVNMSMSAAMRNYNYSTMIPTGSGPTFAP